MKIDTERLNRILNETQEEDVQEEIKQDAKSDDLDNRYWDEQDFENTWILHIRRLAQ